MITVVYLPTMASGLRRYHDTGHSHFVTFSCFRRTPLLVESRACNALLHALEKMRKKFDMQIYGFVFIPEHAHLRHYAFRETLEVEIESEWTASISER